MAVVPGRPLRNGLHLQRTETAQGFRSFWVFRALPGFNSAYAVVVTGRKRVTLAVCADIPPDSSAACTLYRRRLLTSHISVTIHLMFRFQYNPTVRIIKRISSTVVPRIISVSPRADLHEHSSRPCLCLSLLLPCRREENIVEHQTVSCGLLVQCQLSRRIIDQMLIILRVMSP